MSLYPRLRCRRLEFDRTWVHRRDRQEREHNSCALYTEYHCALGERRVHENTVVHTCRQHSIHIPFMRRDDRIKWGPARWKTHLSTENIPPAQLASLVRGDVDVPLLELLNLRLRSLRRKAKRRYCLVSGRCGSLRSASSCNTFEPTARYESLQSVVTVVPGENKSNKHSPRLSYRRSFIPADIFAA